MNLFLIQTILMATLNILCKTDDVSKYALTYKDRSGEFDITVPNAIFLRAVLSALNQKNKDAFEEAYSLLKTCYTYSVDYVNKMFRVINDEYLFKLIFKGGGGSDKTIEEIKEHTLNNEMQYFTQYADLSKTEILKAKESISGELVINTNATINDFTETVKNQVITKLNEEFKIYLDKLTEMKEVGKEKIISVDKKSILGVIEENFNILPTKIDKLVADSSDKFILEVKKRCQDENNQNITMFEKETKDLEDAILNYSDVTIVDNYKEIVDGLLVTVLKGFDADLFLYLEVHLADISKIFKKVYDDLTEVIETEKKKQLQSMRSLVIKFNDDFVDDLLNKE